jgi:putative phosphoesterase
MRIGLLSDIHANAHALRAVLKSAKEKNVEKLLCCGDYVGYYYEPDRVFALLDEWDWKGVSGNHEAMLLDWLNGIDKTKIKNKYGSGISLAAEKLKYKILSQLYEMPKVIKLKIENYKVLLCHGSPWDRDIYVYPDTGKKTVDKMFNHDPDFDVLIYGHTHYPVIWEQNNRKIINPGSVGQPRDRKPGASWALWETTTNNVEFFREKYDVNSVIKMCKKYDPDIGYLVDVLVRT